MGFRRSTSILSETPAPAGGPYGLTATATQDADLVLTAAVLGFTASRLVVGHPVEFVFEDVEDEPGNQQAVGLVRHMLSRTAAFPLSREAVNAVSVARSQPWQEASLITGAAGSARTPFTMRNAVPTSSDAEELRRIAADQTDPLGYQGLGAYTGLLDDPVRQSGTVTSTVRSNVPEAGFGDRWLPPIFHYADVARNEHTHPWGLLNQGDPIPGIEGPEPEVPGIVGYAHGMVQVIYLAAARGPWCTPFEIAVGKVTTKLASCFLCTLFMYAAGYPPSAIHLGRADSWLPFYPKAPGERGYGLLDEAIAATNARWQLECRQQLELGARILHDSRDHLVAPDRLTALQAFLETRAGELYAGGNLLLDAVTVPGKISRRIVDTVDGALLSAVAQNRLERTLS